MWTPGGGGDGWHPLSSMPSLSLVGLHSPAALNSSEAMAVILAKATGVKQELALLGLAPETSCEADTLSCLLSFPLMLADYKGPSGCPRGSRGRRSH